LIATEISNGRFDDCISWEAAEEKA
jgi:hypothetical protein